MNFPERLNIAVFASGRGSNFLTILKAIKNGQIQNTEIVVVISNNVYAGALSIARENSIPAVHLSREQFESSEIFNEVLLSTLHKYDVNFIALAGYLKKIDPIVIRSFRNRIINIHPALLPKFGGSGMYGIRVHEAVIKSGAKRSGATVHIVDEEYDHGLIVLQRAIDVSPEDTPQSLDAKVLKIEHELYPEAIRLFAANRVTIDNHNVIRVS